jgi:hypothetical protein
MAQELPLKFFLAAPGIPYRVTRRTAAPLISRNGVVPLKSPMGVPSPCASRRVGDPTFAHMKRSVCLGARLFPIGFITRHTSKRVLGCRIHKQPVFQDRWCFLVSRSSLQTWFDGWAEHHAGTRVEQLTSFTMHTGLADRRNTCLLPSSALRACCCPPLTFVAG